MERVAVRAIMKWANIMTSACMVLAVSACARGDQSLTTQNAALIERSMVIGTTTEDQAKAMFGAPRHAEINNGDDTWSYDFTTPHVSPAGVIPGVQILSDERGANKKELTLVFDQSHLLRHWAFVETNFRLYHGL